MKTIRLLFAAAFALTAAQSLHAQGAWPVKTVRIIVPLPPGGPSDIVLRAGDRLGADGDFVGAGGGAAGGVDDEGDLALAQRKGHQLGGRFPRAFLRALAELEPPAHDCARRRAILAARAELGAGKGP